MEKNFLIISRISPFLNFRNTFLVQVLRKLGRVTVLTEKTNLRSAVDNQGGELILKEKILRPSMKWPLAKALRVIFFNIIAFFEIIHGRRRYEYIICADVPYSIPGLLAKILFKKKFIIDMHEIVWDMGYPRWISRFYKLVEKLVLRKAELVFLPSVERAHIVFSTHGIRKRHLIFENYPPVETIRINKGLLRRKLADLGFKNDKMIIMYQGSVTPLNLKGLVALSKLVEKHEFVLCIQGYGPLLAEFRKHCLHRENSPICFLEACTNDYAIEWLSGADIAFVYYEPNNLNTEYACSAKFYSAVFAQVPILCNRLKAFEIFATRYGGVVIYDSLQDLEQVIVDLIHDKNKLNRLKEEIKIASRSVENVMSRRKLEILEQFQKL